MSITFRLACPILITPMMCLLVGVAAVQDSEPAAADTAGLLEKGFSNLPTTRRVTDVAGGARHTPGEPRCPAGSLPGARRTGPSGVVGPSSTRTLHTPQPPLTQPTGMPLRPRRNMPCSRLSVEAQA